MEIKELWRNPKLLSRGNKFETHVNVLKWPTSDKSMNSCLSCLFFSCHGNRHYNFNNLVNT